MTTTHQSSDWTAQRSLLQALYPNLNPERFVTPPADPQSLTLHLSQTHDLTFDEAAEQLDGLIL